MRKDEIELRIEEIISSFLDDPEMLASLAVGMADHYRKTHGQGNEVLKALEAHRKDVEMKLGNFAKAIAQGIFNETTAAAMRSLEDQKRELDDAIQTENVRTALFEDEASIGAFYKRFAKATLDTVETRDQLFEYFIDKIYLSKEQIVVVTYYFDSVKTFEVGDLDEALENLHENGELRTFPRASRREFDSSPFSGDAGNRTLVR